MKIDALQNGVTVTSQARIPSSSFSITCGILLCRSLRDLLEGEEFMGRNIHWREGRGWLERKFDVRGDPVDVSEVYERIRHWKQSVDAS